MGATEQDAETQMLQDPLKDLFPEKPTLDDVLKSTAFLNFEDKLRLISRLSRMIWVSLEYDSRSESEALEQFAPAAHVAYTLHVLTERLESLAAELSTPSSSSQLSLLEAFAHLNVTISEQEIDEARQEMWSRFIEKSS